MYLLEDDGKHVVDRPSTAVCGSELSAFPEEKKKIAYLQESRSSVLMPPDDSRVGIEPPAIDQTIGNATNGMCPKN